ncbi:hypothetical protein TI05_14705 [Achromatium sp. WMS3]|nr:hypothetical protein TI05_14705 [Achromatium sp. WMS3]
MLKYILLTLAILFASSTIQAGDYFAVHGCHRGIVQQSVMPDVMVGMLLIQTIILILVQDIIVRYMDQAAIAG